MDSNKSANIDIPHINTSTKIHITHIKISASVVMHWNTSTKPHLGVINTLGRL